MTDMVRVHLSGVLIALGAMAFALAACGGNGAAPITSDVQSEIESTGKGCPPPLETYGEAYVVITDTGNVKNGTFTPILNHSVWERVIFVQGSSPPPTIPPHPAIFVYRGTYNNLFKGVTSTGCAVLITSQNGLGIKAFGGANAQDTEAPVFAGGVKVRTLLGVGRVTTLKITSLSATGGHGSYTLSDGSSGTMTFTLRQSIP